MTRPPPPVAPPVFEEPEDPGSRSFFSEIISSVSDVKFSHSGRYLLTRDYLTAKVWDLNMDKGPVETYQVSPVAACLALLLSVTSLRVHLVAKHLQRWGFSESVYSK